MTDYTTWRVIGQGTERTCYQNPVDQNRCVKIIRKARFKQTLREIEYFSFLRRKGVPFDHLPEFYSKVEGPGYIGIEQELIRDANSESASSPTIRTYLSAPRTDDELKAFWNALFELKSYLLEYNVLALGIDYNNIVVQHTENGMRMVLIDGVYDTEWIPISKYFHYFGNKKILRRWSRFMLQLRDTFPDIFRVIN